MTCKHDIVKDKKRTKRRILHVVQPVVSSQNKVMNIDLLCLTYHTTLLLRVCSVLRCGYLPFMVHQYIHVSGNCEELSSSVWIKPRSPNTITEALLRPEWQFRWDFETFVKFSDRATSVFCCHALLTRPLEIVYLNSIWIQLSSTCAGD